MAIKYKYRVESGSHHHKKTRYMKGETFISNLPLHLTLKNKFTLIDEFEVADPVAPQEAPSKTELPKPPSVDEIPECPACEIPKEDPTEIDPPDPTEASSGDPDEDIDDDSILLEFPLKVDQVSARRYNVADANGLIVGENLTRKKADALIKEYTESAELAED